MKELIPLDHWWLDLLPNKKEYGWISEPYNLSPFSEKGPGPAYIIKPDIVHLGGNAGVNSKGEIIQGGVKSFF